MLLRGVILCCLIGWVGTPAAAQEWARKIFESTSHDFGTVAKNAKAEYAFVFRNIYLEDVHVVSARPSCGCISTELIDPHLKTYAKGAILAKLNTKAYLGHRNVTITVTFDKPYRARVQLNVKGYIRDDVSVKPGVIDLGRVSEGTPTERTIEVSRRGWSNWRVVEVASLNPHITARVIDTRWERSRATARILVRLDQSAPAGPIREHLVLKTNDSYRNGFPVQIEGEIAAPVTVTPSSLFMGVLGPGEKVTKQLVVRGSKPFRITSVTSDGGTFEFQSVGSEESKPLHVIPITFIAGEEPGREVRTIRIETDLDESKPELSTFAVVRP